MKRVDVTSRKEQRKFGVMMGAAFAAFGLLRWWLVSHTPYVFFGLGIVFFVLGLLAPRTLGPVFAVWMRFAEALNWVMTRVLLTLVFYGLITPARYLNGWFGSDPLKRTWDPSASTYWESPDEQPAELERYKNQY